MRAPYATRIGVWALVGGGVFAGIAGADWCKSFVFKGSLSISGV